MLIFFFFFQAEDGIRDGRVTGVQTCALPILSTGRLSDARAALERATHSFADKNVLDKLAFIRKKEDAMHVANAYVERSEERRVGKECRSRWATEQSKKKSEK